MIMIMDETMTSFPFSLLILEAVNKHLSGVRSKARNLPCNGSLIWLHVLSIFLSFWCQIEDTSLSEERNPLTNLTQTGELMSQWIHEITHCKTACLLLTLDVCWYLVWWISLSHFAVCLPEERPAIFTSFSSLSSVSNDQVIQREWEEHSIRYADWGVTLQLSDCDDWDRAIIIIIIGFDRKRNHARATSPHLIISGQLCVSLLMCHVIV